MLNYHKPHTNVLVQMVILFVLTFIPAVLGYTQTKPDALEQYRLGRDLENRGRTQEAQPFYNEAIRICSDEIAKGEGTRDSYTVLTWTLQRQLKYAEVIVWGERALRQFGDDYRIIQIMGEAYFYLNDYDRSLRFMQNYLNSMPQGDRAGISFFFVGEIFRLRNKFYLADMAYSTAVKLEPGTALWWYRLGTVREAYGDLPLAAESYEQALKYNPNYQQARNNLDRIRPTAPEIPPTDTL